MNFLTASVDAHVHVFDRKQKLDTHRRYQPDYDAEPEALLNQMELAGVSHAVLVQPSFLGTNNEYLLSAIARYPERFLGIAVVDLQTTRTALIGLRDQGIRGIRLNFIGKPLPDIRDSIYREFFSALADTGLHLQVQAEGEQWLGIAENLSLVPCPVVVDHFGRTPLSSKSGGFQSLLSSAENTDRVWFKFSGPYRFDGADRCAELIIESLGDNRIVWGSDWPWTQCEGRHSYADTLSWVSDWMRDDAARIKVLADNPRRLYAID